MGESDTCLFCGSSTSYPYEISEDRNLKLVKCAGPCLDYVISFDAEDHLAQNVIRKAEVGTKLETLAADETAEGKILYIFLENNKVQGALKDRGDWEQLKKKP